MIALACIAPNEVAACRGGGFSAAREHDTEFIGLKANDDLASPKA